MKKSILSLMFAITSLLAYAQGIVPFKAGEYKFGFKDKNGKVIIEPKYYYATDFGIYDANFSRVEFNGRVGLVNAYGKEIAEPKYFSIEKFSEGLAVARMGNDNYGFIDTTGKEVIPLKYNGAKSFFNGYAIVTMYDKKSKPSRGIIDKTGKEVTPIKYEELYGFDDNGLCLFEQGGKKGFIDKSGKEVLSFTKYDRIDYFSHNRASVSRKDKWGYINRTGKEIIPLKYDIAENFNTEGLAKVRAGSQYLLIDTLGNLAKGNVGFNITAKVNVAKDRWVVVTSKELKASEPVYFLTSDKYGKNPAPFGAAITWQIIDDKGNVIKEQRTQAGESCGFKVPKDGSYTVQAYYDMRDCTGCRSEDKPGAFTMGYSFNTSLL